MPDDTSWEAATWEGARRARLRRSLERTVRERLQALAALTGTSDRLAEAGERAREGQGRAPADEPSARPDP